MDVYEKPTGRSAWLLGLVALRELLVFLHAFPCPSPHAYDDPTPIPSVLHTFSRIL